MSRTTIPELLPDDACGTDCPGRHEHAPVSGSSSEDTIAAIATAPGSAAIGIVRLAGPGCAAILSTVFRPLSPSFSGFSPFRLHHGELLDVSGRPLDDVLAVFMPGPGTFCGQDMAELHCHGSPAVLAEALTACCAHGARPAEPGEFSKRAFLAGRLDLSQAEAVAELAAAPTADAARLAREKLSGALSTAVSALRERLADLRARACLAIDFPDEDVECLPPGEFRAEALAVKDELASLAANFARGRLAREGALAVLAGPVNAGKSSLMNALLGRERAIVSDAPGTTRDYLEEPLSLDGLLVRLVDTAGLRETEDHVELVGVRKSRELLQRADLVLLVVDGSRPLGAAEVALCREVPRERLLACVNKADLSPCADDPLPRLTESGVLAVRVAASTGLGLDELSRSARERLLAALPPDEGRPAPNLRQQRCLTRAAAELDELVRAVDQGLPYDLLGLHLEHACDALDEITGRLTAEDVLNRVFADFCIGK